MKGPVLLLPLLALVLSLPGTSWAATSRACEDAVVHDWSDGRIDGTYPLDCYRAALRSLPEDLRVYSSATDDINRALRARITAARPTPKQKGRQLSSRSAGAPETKRAVAAEEDDFAAPVPLLALAAVTILFLAGASAHLAGNLRASRRRS